jgi:hypothetical protein
MSKTPSETRNSRRGGNAAAGREWFVGLEQNRPMRELVDETGYRMRNRNPGVHLKGLAGRKRHTGVVTNAGYETPVVGKFLDRAVRVADVDGGSTVEGDRGCLCVEKGLHQASILLRPTELEYDSGASRDADSPPAPLH